METFFIDGQGVVLDGQTITRAAAREAARVFLISDVGYTEDLADAVTDGSLVVRAWWGSEAVGFVNETWEGCTPVTVVNLNMVGLSA